MRRIKWKFVILTGIVALVLITGRCDNFFSAEEPTEAEEPPDTEVTYLNHSDTVGYVGIETCKQCHSQIYETYIHTGMGSSFGVADTSKSIAEIEAGKLLHDPHLDLYYHPLWQKDSLLLREFRLKGHDTVFLKEQLIDYVVGSGQHTNSHIFEINGHLYQAPFTWYSQKGKLDLPPGYEEGDNVRFSRKIGLECTSCHNSMPTGFVQGSVNKYTKVPGAIDCERCHGPGELHVKRMRTGDLVDTATEIDYSIVNVKKLPEALQFEVCQRCHLQGNSVLAEGKSFMDFKPGMKLSEVMDIYLPRYSNAEDDFIMASHVDRFRQSACVIDGPVGFNCTSCHNPHVSVRETAIESFNSTCQNCHSPGPRHECTADLSALQEADFNCVGCHMPKSTSIDIPHVTVHDHKIKVPGKVTDTTGIKKFLELVAVNNDQPSDRSKALAYLQQFEKFESKAYYLDSARFFLNRLGNRQDHIELWVAYYFLRQDYAAIQEMLRKTGASNVLESLNQKSYDNQDGWTAYRIGEALNHLGDQATAEDFLQRATELVPFNPDFLNKYAGVLASRNKFAAALEVYQKALAEKPNHKEVLNNLGFLYLKMERLEEARRYFKLGLKEDPDYELAWLNLANVEMLLNNKAAAERALKEALRINPGNVRAREALNYIKESS